MWIDFHNHCLPQIDDGSGSIQTSVKILEQAKSQLVSTVIATPHFYAHRETIECFLERREQSYNRLQESIAQDSCANIILGSEVRIEKEIQILDVKKLCIQNTNILLLEPPFLKHRRRWWSARR